MIIPSWSADQAATVQALLTGVALAFAICVPALQQRQTKAAEDKRRSNELAAIRLALHTEVAMVAKQCRIELSFLIALPPPPAPYNFRSARFPSLVIYEGSSSKIGLLTRDEIVWLIAFSGSMNDIASVVDDKTQRQAQGPDDREDPKLVLSNACGPAADFLEAVPGIPDADQDRPYIETLRVAYRQMDSARDKKPPSSR
jgi:hypothetical protein